MGIFFSKSKNQNDTKNNIIRNLMLQEQTNFINQLSTQIIDLKQTINMLSNENGKLNEEIEITNEKNSELRQKLDNINDFVNNGDVDNVIATKFEHLLRNTVCLQNNDTKKQYITKGIQYVEQNIKLLLQ